MTEVSAKLRIDSPIREMWSAMTALHQGAGEFTTADVMRVAKVGRPTLEGYLSRLLLAGTIEIVRRDTRNNGRRVFRIVKLGRDAPRVTSEGAPLPESVMEILWRSMKMMRDGITTTALAQAVTDLGRDCHREHVGNVVRRLAEVGVLAETSPKRGNVPATYRLVKSLGALPPQILKAEIVFDPNAQAVLGVAEAKEVA